jgi:dolichol-phosphate mannosyltransferase
MDCDFSHRPSDVPRLIAACEGGADVALGSRYVAGGGTADWGLVRRAVSAGGSLYARTLLGVGVRDLTGGFKCFRRGVLETIDLDAIAARGYAFQIEDVPRCVPASCRQIPITFSTGARRVEMSDRLGRCTTCRCALGALRGARRATDAAFAGGPRPGRSRKFTAPWAVPGDPSPSCRARARRRRFASSAGLSRPPAARAASLLPGSLLAGEVVGTIGAQP